MALETKLNIDGIDYDVLECEYEFIQPIESNGQPSGRPNGGLIHFILYSQDDNNMFFHEWMMNKTGRKDGVFSFSLKNDLTKKTLAFSDAYCIRLYEYFNKHSDAEMYMKITISANQILFGKRQEVIFKMDTI